MSSTPKLQFCNKSSDCDASLRNNSTIVVKFCYEEMNGREENNFCDCSYNFGFSGEFCDQPNFQSFWFGGFTIFLIITILLSLILVGHILFKERGTVKLVITRVEECRVKKDLVYLLMAILIEGSLETTSLIIQVNFIYNPETAIPWTSFR